MLQDMRSNNDYMDIPDYKSGDFVSQDCKSCEARGFKISLLPSQGHSTPPSSVIAQS